MRLEREMNYDDREIMIIIFTIIYDEGMIPWQRRNTGPGLGYRGGEGCSDSITS